MRRPTKRYKGGGEYNEKLSKNNIITIALIIAIYAIVFVLEKVIDSNSMLFIVLKRAPYTPWWRFP